MKKIFALLVLALSIGSAHAFSGNDKVINKNQLPAQAQSFINEYFAGAKISYAKLETDFLVNSYEVMLADGTKLGRRRLPLWRGSSGHHSRSYQGLREGKLSRCKSAQD